MSARRPLARLLCPMPLLALLQGCAAIFGSSSGTVEGTADSTVVARDTARAPGPPSPDEAVKAFQPSAPNEIVSEAVISRRRFIVGDMIRADIATVVEQGPPGVVRVGLGRGFHSQGSREFYFRRLASAYYNWISEDRPLVIELWEGGQKIGEYTNGVFAMGEGYTRPLGCPEDAADPCGPGAPPRPAPVAEAPAGPPPGPPPEPALPTRERDGFHAGLGLGAGVADLACRGCTDAGETGVSGLLALGAWVGDKTVLGVEGTGWTGGESGASSDVYSLTATVTRYLSANSGFFVGAGLGLVGCRGRCYAGFADDVSARSVGFSGRVGYDIGTGSYVIVPYLGLVRTFAGADFKSDGEDIGFNAAVSNLQFGVSVGVR